MMLEALDTQTETLGELRDVARQEVKKIVIGHEQTIELLLIAAVAGGHVLLEGPPGSAKTILAGAAARVLGVQYKRVQFTPDTTPNEIIGATTVRGGEPIFTPGPIFTNVLLADEINRTPPRTQAALLEAMQERHVTLDGNTKWLPKPFMVIATQNPFEHDGVFALPESQLDRFLFKAEMEYCNEEEDLQILQLPHTGVTPDMIGEVRPLLGPVGLERARATLDATALPDSVARYVVTLIRATREHPGVELGAGPRAMIHLAAAARAKARLAGRDTVNREDVALMAPFVLRHRILTHGSLTSAQVIERALETAAG